jgi:hypothetical protein
MTHFQSEEIGVLIAGPCRILKVSLLTRALPIRMHIGHMALSILPFNSTNLQQTRVKVLSRTHLLMQHDCLVIYKTNQSARRYRRPPMEFPDADIDFGRIASD